jgi:hydrogenase-4 component E
MMSSIDLCVLSAAVLACLMVGSLHLRLNLWMYGATTMCIALATAMTAQAHAEFNLIYIALLIAALKAAGIPLFLRWTSEKLNVHRDVGAMIAPPLAMHLSIGLLALSFLLTRGLPAPEMGTTGWYGATAGISLLFTGLVVMLTRKLAIGQILGFLVIENGIYVFALTQTLGMPLLVEMGVLLDMLVGVMVSGLLVFKIQKSFEHIDVAQLTSLKE